MYDVGDVGKVQGLGFRVSEAGLKFRVCGLELGCRTQDVVVPDDALGRGEYECKRFHLEG